MYGGQKDNKNAYVLFVDKAHAKAAAEALNQSLFKNKHLRVDIDSKTKD